MDTDVLDEFTTILNEVLAESAGELTWEALEGIGWPDLLSEDPVAAIQVLFAGQARYLIVTPALEALTLAALGVDATPAEAGVLFDASPPRDTTGSLLPAGRAGERIQVTGTVARGPLAGVPDRFVAVVTTERGDVTAFVEGLSDYLAAAPLAGLAPETGWRRVEGAEVTIVDAIDAGDSAQEGIAYARQLVHLAVAHELASIAETALGMASDHVRSREQFGRPLGAFQAVKHRLAQSAVESAAAATTLAVADASIGSNDDPSVLVARIQASVAATECLSHAQQVFGGMGYSWELPLHRYVRRAFLLETIDGPLASLERQLGRHLLDMHPVPRLAVFG